MNPARMYYEEPESYSDAAPIGGYSPPTACLGDCDAASLNCIIAQGLMDADATSPPLPCSGNNAHQIPIHQAPMCSACTPSNTSSGPSCLIPVDDDDHSIDQFSPDFGQHGSANTTASDYYGHCAQEKWCQICAQPISSNNRHTAEPLILRRVTDPLPQGQAFPARHVRRSNTETVATGRTDPRQPGVISPAERRYRCKDCGQGFTERCNAVRHRTNSHRAGAKPQPACGMCGKSFRSDNLKRHQKRCYSPKFKAAG